MDNDRASQSQRKRKNPSFFKVLIQDFSTRLQIPPAFNKVFGKEVPKKAILETYYGKSEEVEVEKHENRFCFCKGWSKFVENNKLENGDFLVFKYLLDCSKFKVKIYGKTCYEKEHYCPSETGKNEDERDGRKRKREEEKEQDNNVKVDGTFKAAKRIETDSDSDSDFGEEASEDEPINLDSDTDSSSSHPIVEEEIGNSKQPSSEEENGQPKSLQSDNQIEFKPERPSFRVKLKSSSISSYLNIPLSFSRKYIKECQSQEIKLETPNKKVWELGLFVLWGVVDKKKEMAGARLTQGWRNLVSEYHLQMGDICIFELIQPIHDLVFYLHVFRRDAQNKKFIRIL